MVYEIVDCLHIEKFGSNTFLRFLPSGLGLSLRGQSKGGSSGRSQVNGLGGFLGRLGGFPVLGGRRRGGVRSLKGSKAGISPAPRGACHLLGIRRRSHSFPRLLPTIFFAIHQGRNVGSYLDILK